MSCKIKYSSIVFKGVIKDYKSKFIKKEVIEAKGHTFMIKIKKWQYGDPKGNLYIRTSQSKTFH